MISFMKALSLIDNHVHPVSSRIFSIYEAKGCTVAESVKSPIDSRYPSHHEFEIIIRTNQSNLDVVTLAHNMRYADGAVT